MAFSAAGTRSGHERERLVRPEATECIGRECRVAREDFQPCAGICPCQIVFLARNVKPRKSNDWLTLHPEKTKIVYRKDANRRGDFPNLPGPINVRCYSNSDIIVRRSEVTVRATSGLMH